MIIDAHTHIFPHLVRSRREGFFDGEPDFFHIYGNPKSTMVGVGELIRAMDENGVDISIVFGFPWRNIETARMHNDYVLEAVARHPDRLWGLACVYPLSAGADKELARALDAGMRGVGELAIYMERSISDLREVMGQVVEVLRQYKSPLLLHCNENVGHTYPGKADIRLKTMYQFVKHLPETPMILAHWGGGLFFYELMKKEVQRVMRNIYYDTAASPFLYRPDVYEIAARICGDHKVIFGSDYPLIPPKRYFKEMEEAGLTQEQIRKVCGENVQAIFKP